MDNSTDTVEIKPIIQQISPQEVKVPVEKEPPIEQPKINLKPKSSVSGISSLSLASIQKKKEWEQRQKPNNPNENEARDPFTQEDLEKHWKAYQAKKNKEKEQNIASLFQLSTPKMVTNEVIDYNVPSDLNKVELEREFQYFLPFLRSALNNYGLEINVCVEATDEKNFIYTPEEKYQRLQEINPNLDILRKELDLDL